jgi:autotransporter-associated beta strand protein
MGGQLALTGDLTFTGNTNTNTVTIAAPTGTGLQGVIALNGTRTFDIGNGSAAVDLTVNTPLINGTSTGGLTKTGSGTLALTGINTYTGPTNVNNGMLVIIGNSSTATGNVTVAAGASLGGGGTLGGATTFNGILAPGNSIGTLTVNNDVTWNGATTAGSTTDWQFELGLSNAADLLDITGTGSDFLKGSGAIFRFDFLGGTETGTYKLVDWTSTTNFVFTDFSYTNLGGGNTGTFSITGSQLNFTVVPEPNVAALIGGFGAIILLRRRRHA